ncbi:hypothetical protein [Actinokineospora sp. NBRC 105648]|uniref:hypothetical protein n=1 Tax=Actinokineospora sp. NBRC 105648 TaxID=3032206 RepID=UPI0024A32DAD|nr:hypothetical protein [Actinokineospora sp. NBRC 105648]GLZ43317.1 hypothetical protein Acsp05_69410 [Actinokineospora sp. NBRC 105648]
MDTDSARSILFAAIGLTAPWACVVDVAADVPAPIAGKWASLSWKPVARAQRAEDPPPA